MQPRGPLSHASSNASLHESSPSAMVNPVVFSGSQRASSIRWQIFWGVLPLHMLKLGFVHLKFSDSIANFIFRFLGKILLTRKLSFCHIFWKSKSLQNQVAFFFSLTCKKKTYWIIYYVDLVLKMLLQIRFFKCKHKFSDSIVYFIKKKYPRPEILFSETTT